MAAHHNKQDDGNNLGLVFIPLVLFGALWLLWSRERAPIIYLLYGPDYLEYSLLKTLHLLGDINGQKMLRYVHACLTHRLDPSTVTLDEIRAVQTDVGYRMRFFILVPMALLVFQVLTKMKGDGLTRKFTLSGRSRMRVWHLFGVRLPSPLAVFPKFLEKLNIGSLRMGDASLRALGMQKESRWMPDGMSFMHYQSQHWTVTRVGSEFDPDKPEIEMSQSLTPTEWMRDNGVGFLEDGSVDEEKAEEAFARQLGQPWTGFADAPIYVQALMVIALQTLRKGSHDKSVGKIRGEFTLIFKDGLTPAAGKAAGALIKSITSKDKGMVRLIDDRTNMHAYLNVAVLSFIGWCGAFPEADWGGGEGSINCPAMWLWLKRIDRTLFYVLQEHGRKSFYVEGAGAVSHYYTESMLQSPQMTPEVSSAIDGLSEYMTHHGITDLDKFFKGRVRRRLMV